MAKNSRAKGARGERELSSKLKEYGYNCRRGQQYCGANGILMRLDYQVFI